MSEIFDEAFMNMLPSDPWRALETIADAYNEAVPQQPTPDDIYTISAATFLLAKAFCAEYLPEVTAFAFDLNIHNQGKAVSQVDSAFNTVRGLINTRNSNQTFENMQARATALVGKVDAIEFTEGDLERIQELINETRDVVTNSDEFEPRHQQRILDKLEKLQAALHKRMTKVDEFYLLLPDAGLALGKFGENARPFVENVKELMQIVFRYQAQRDQLPSSYRPDFLPNPDSVEDDDTEASDAN